MTTKVYCYHCMTYHPPESMQKIMTRTGERWRCVRTIEAARSSPAARDAFGARQSELNKARTRAVQENTMLGRRLAQLTL